MLLSSGRGLITASAYLSIGPHNFVGEGEALLRFKKRAGTKSGLTLRRQRELFKVDRLAHSRQGRVGGIWGHRIAFFVMFREQRALGIVLYTNLLQHLSFVPPHTWP
jgi:hypothetical protein